MVLTLERKKITESCFDVTMGGFDGAKIYEFFGIHIKHWQISAYSFKRYIVLI